MQNKAEILQAPALFHFMLSTERSPLAALTSPVCFSARKKRQLVANINNHLFYQQARFTLRSLLPLVSSDVQGPRARCWLGHPDPPGCSVPHGARKTITWVRTEPLLITELTHLPALPEPVSKYLFSRREACLHHLPSATPASFLLGLPTICAQVPADSALSPFWGTQMPLSGTSGWESGQVLEEDEKEMQSPMGLLYEVIPKTCG